MVIFWTPGVEMGLLLNGDDDIVTSANVNAIDQKRGFIRQPFTNEV
jgi:hypothetical protein